MDNITHHNTKDDTQINSSEHKGLSCFCLLQYIRSYFHYIYIICIPAPSPRRGKTKCQKWRRKREADQRPVDIEIPPELMRVVVYNSTQFISEASYLMKQCMPLDVEKWGHIHADKKRKFLMKLKVFTLSLTLSIVNPTPFFCY